MSDTLALPPRLMMRDLLLTAATQKGRVLLIFFCVMALSVAIAVSIKPDYKTHSSLLVLMGTEHTFRPAAGQQFTNSGGVDAEQVLRTEASILASDDLHRTVIRDIGIEKLYPKLLEKPGVIEQYIQDFKQSVMELLGLAEPKGNGPNDVMSRAVEQFAKNLTITVDKKSSVIGLDFTNPDKTISAATLKDLEDRYLELRQKLYGDVQAPIVKVQQQQVGKQLAEADAALQGFKRDHDISSFSERRTVLLKQQGDLEIAIAKSEGSIAGLTARLNQLNGQLAAVTGAKKGSAPNAASALQGMVQTYKQREEDAQTRYRGSPAVDEARRQMLERETDIARMQATQAYGVQTDRNKTEADLRTDLATHDTLMAQLTTLNKQIDALDAEESQLHALERSRAVLEDNYRAVTKILDERQVVETVEANRESSVRVIQPPVPPSLPQPTRRLILLAGVVVSLLLSIGSILMAHFFRAIYLRPEALEMDTGLTVLASVPEMRALGRPSTSVMVVPS